MLGDLQIAHFDIKCDNILVEPLHREGYEVDPFELQSEVPPFKVVVADFGEARMFDSSEQAMTLRYKLISIGPFLSEVEHLQLRSIRMRRECCCHFWCPLRNKLITYELLVFEDLKLICIQLSAMDELSTMEPKGNWSTVEARSHLDTSAAFRLVKLWDLIFAGMC